MDKSAKRIRQMRLYNEYEIEDLAARAGMRPQLLEYIEASKVHVSSEDARDLSQFLGVDGSYLEGKEEVNYIGYVKSSYLFNEEGLFESEVFEQAFIPSSIELYEITGIVYNRRNDEFKNKNQCILLCSDNSGDGYYIIESHNHVLEATCTNGQMTRLGKAIEDYKVLYKVEKIVPTLEDAMRELVNKVKKGEITL